MYNYILNAVESFSKPEFLNRLDDLVVFIRVSRADIRVKVRIQIESQTARLLHNNIGLELNDLAYEHLASIGYDPAYGARPLKRVIQRELENKIAQLVLENEKINVVKVTVVDGQLVVR